MRRLRPARRPPFQRPRARRGALTLAVLVALALSGACADEPDRADADTAPVLPSTTTSTIAPTTTAIVVERSTLPPGTQEFVTVKPELDQVAVRARPPAGWDRRLTPVVTSSDPEPPRSGLDVDRRRLPDAEQSITGRVATPSGWVFTNPTAYEPPQPLVFGVVQRQGDWIQVRVPVRPNGTSGWLRSRNVTLSSTTRSVQVSLSERRLRVLDAGQVLMDVPAGIGRPATPTPTGEFTVTDLVPSANPAGGYGPIALALDGYSEVMDSFAGENGDDAPDANVPVLAIHGTNRPDSVGRAQSNGCPRLYNDDVVQLAAMVPAGTPVQIWP